MKLMMKFIEKMLPKVKIKRKLKIIKIYFFSIFLLFLASCKEDLRKRINKPTIASFKTSSTAHGIVNKINVKLLGDNCEESFLLILPNRFKKIIYKNNILCGYYRSNCEVLYDSPIKEGYILLINIDDNKIKARINVKNIFFDGYILKK